MIATTIAAVASMAMVSIFMMSSQYVAQGYNETRILNNASVAVENMTREINLAFKASAILASNRPTVSNNSETFTFTVPVGLVTSQRRFRYDNVAKILHFEVNNGGVWQDRANKVFLRDVDSFKIFMGGLQGFVSFEMIVKITMQGTDKRFTMVGRAMPRNI